MKTLKRSVIVGNGYKKRITSGRSSDGLRYIPSEHEEQTMLFDWAEWEAKRHPELSLLFAIPNGGRRHIAVARRLKSEGVKPGVPDLCLPVSRDGYHGLFVEMKRQKGGGLTRKQKEWALRLRKEGYRVEVCRGFEEAKREVLSYLLLGEGSAGETTREEEGGL